MNGPETERAPPPGLKDPGGTLDMNGEDKG